ncbi:zinc ribbon domain-containing protein [Dehalococcoidia bacterium]|nr:zinc ribbon domain-containing protein [Dehalococcoidia bacterium]
MNEHDIAFEIEDEISNHYVYSYGGISRFFRSIVEDQQLLGTRCPKCARVLCPPRVHCSECYVSTQWIPIEHTGTVRSAAPIYYVPSNYSLHRYVSMPYILALVQLDGVDNCLYNTVHVPEVVLGAVTPGMRVQTIFRGKREGRLTDFYFTPLNP